MTVVPTQYRTCSPWMNSFRAGDLDRVREMLSTFINTILLQADAVWAGTGPVERSELA